MLKALVISIAIIIAVVNASAQTTGTIRRHTTRKAGVVRVGPSTTYLKEGFTLEEVLRLLGEPASITEHKSGSDVVTTYEFPRGQNRVLIAEFVKGELVSSRVETHEELARKSLVVTNGV
jgi:bifunctional ADP-heptose synthase (sugar kinase/adenylyltransferase)